VLRRMSKAIGSLEITEVDDGSSVCKILNGTGFKVGDLAKTLTQ
jgi:hypothetical protein